nr:hypothetical protein [Tanacetum cinerariifolium]
STNVVNAPREPFVVKQDHGVKSSRNRPPIDECCCECGNALDGIFCQQCICKSCGKGVHIGYNCPPKVSIISNLEPCNQTINNELPQTLPSFDSVPCVSKPHFVDEPSNIFNPPPQHSIYSCELCGSNAQYGHYCTPQAPFNNPEQGYSQDFNFPQYIHNFQQQSKKRSGLKKSKRLKRYWKIPACCDDDDDYDSSITPVLFTEEANNSLSMGDEHLDTIPATKSDEVIKSSVKDLVPIPSEFEGIPDTIDDISSSDDDSLHEENIEYVETLPHDSELVSLEATEIVISKVEEIEDEDLREKFLNVHLLIANIQALKDNPTQSSELLTKSSSTSLNSLLEDANTFHNSLPKFENFYFDLGEISSGSTTTHSDISLPDYEAFYLYDDHVKEISSGSTTTHSDISLFEYDSFIFDLTNEEFTDELAHIISPPEYDRFYFWNFPDPGELMYVLNSKIRENLSTTLVTLPIEDDYSPLLAYIVWIFLTMGELGQALGP